jgi:hypothetical protein
MKKKTLEKIQKIIWILGFVAVALLIYGIIRALMA